MDDNQRFLQEVDINPFNLMGDEPIEPTEDENLVDVPVDPSPTDDEEQPPTPDPITPDVEEEEEEEEEPDDSDYSASALVLKSYVEAGLNYAGEIKPNLSSKEMLDIVREATKEELRPQLEQEYASQGYNEEFKRSIEFLRNGGSIEELQASFANQSYANLNIDDDEDITNREILIKAYYKDKGFSDHKAEQLLQVAKTNQETYEEAIEAQSHFENKDKTMLENQREVAKRQAEEEKKVYEEHRSKVKTILGSRNLGGLDITDREAKEIENAIYTPSETVEYTDDNGKKVREKITKYDLLVREYNKNPEWQLTFTKLLLDGFKFNKVANKISKKRDDQITDSLNGKLTNSLKKAIKQNDNFKQDGTYPESRFVGEVNIK